MWQSWIVWQDAFMGSGLHSYALWCAAHLFATVQRQLLLILPFMIKVMN